MHIYTKKNLISYNKNKLKNNRLDYSLNIIIINKIMLKFLLTLPAILEIVIFKQSIYWLNVINYLL